jgi:hypothetical protein
MPKIKAEKVGRIMLDLRLVNIDWRFKKFLEQNQKSVIANQ